MKDGRAARAPGEPGCVHEAHLAPLVRPRERLLQRVGDRVGIRLVGAEGRLARRLAQRRVRGRNGGRLVIHFFSDAELQGIYEAIVRE